jgi:hypothetical protein
MMTYQHYPCNVNTLLYYVVQTYLILKSMTMDTNVGIQTLAVCESKDRTQYEPVP